MLRGNRIGRENNKGNRQCHGWLGQRRRRSIPEIERNIGGDELRSTGCTDSRAQSSIRSVDLAGIAIREPDTFPVIGNGTAFWRGQRCVSRNNQNFVGRFCLVWLGSDIEWLEVVSQPAGATRSVRANQPRPGSTLVIFDASSPPYVHPVRFDIDELWL